MISLDVQKLLNEDTFIKMKEAIQLLAEEVERLGDEINKINHKVNNQ
jgi:hypothetical protein